MNAYIRSATVAEPYKMAYPNPIKLKVGDPVLIEKWESNPEWAGWAFCVDRRGIKGWVSEKYLQVDGDSAIAIRDYDATEISAQSGEQVKIHFEEFGWAWIENSQGQQGWIPIKNLSDSKNWIETPRLILRRWRESDKAPFFQMNSDSEVMRYLPKILTQNESDAMIEKIENHFGESGFGWWALELKQTGEFLGFTGLAIPKFESHFTPCVEVGWRLARQFWHKGYATEASRAAVDFGFSKVGLKEIVSFTVPANKPSIAVMERLGMTRNPEEDFDHPKLPAGHVLCKHVLYRLRPYDVAKS